MPRPQNAAVKAALFALRIYKVYLSAFIGGTCRFQPTCSQYMYEAIDRFGVRRGVGLGMKRLARCHPFSQRFGHDPVPEGHELDGENSSRHPTETAAPGSVGPVPLQLQRTQQVGQPQTGARS